MTDEDLRSRANKYASLFASAGVNPTAFDPAVRGPNELQIASHSLWMCRQIPRLLVEQKGSQAREWLRFVEGILCSMGAMSFKDMTSGVTILGA